MDAEEKEELKQNDLMAWFQYGLPLFLKRNGSYILLVFALALLGWELWGYYQKKQAVEVQTAWNELSLASEPNVDNAPIKLQGVINQYDVKPVQALAWLRIGNIYLEDVAMGNPPEGYNGVKASKEDSLIRAEAAFTHILNDFGTQTLVAGSAHMGLAAVAEDKGDWDTAKKQYEALTDKNSQFANTTFAKVGQEKIALLDDLRKAPPLAAMVPAPTTLPFSTDSAIKNLMGPATLPTTAPTK